MTTDSYKLFKAMYLLLDSIWEDNQEEDLRIYLSDADPLFFENGTSMDPAIYEDFNKLYLQKKEELTDYDFIVYYLENLDSYYGNIKKYFISILRTECEKKLSSLIK